ncbi:MAG: hypothetical protein IT462_08195 [Planctomycetes bacterium]|nr:hypothetical protein [Planctomycetota bacterium]
MANKFVMTIMLCLCGAATLSAQATAGMNSDLLVDTITSGSRRSVRSGGWLVSMLHTSTTASGSYWSGVVGETINHNFPHASSRDGGPDAHLKAMDLSRTKSVAGFIFEQDYVQRMNRIANGRLTYALATRNHLYADVLVHDRGGRLLRTLQLYGGMEARTAVEKWLGSDSKADKLVLANEVGRQLNRQLDEVERAWNSRSSLPQGVKAMRKALIGTGIKVNENGVLNYEGRLLGGPDSQTFHGLRKKLETDSRRAKTLRTRFQGNKLGRVGVDVNSFHLKSSMIAGGIVVASGLLDWVRSGESLPDFIVSARGGQLAEAAGLTAVSLAGSWGVERVLTSKSLGGKVATTLGRGVKVGGIAGLLYVSGQLGLDLLHGRPAGESLISAGMGLVWLGAEVGGKYLVVWLTGAPAGPAGWVVAGVISGGMIVWDVVVKPALDNAVEQRLGDATFAATTQRFLETTLPSWIESQRQQAREAFGIK